jgi:hypothetical protein
MSNERSKEELKVLTELFRLVWVTMLAVASGTVSLIFGEPTPLRLLFVGGGLLFTLALITALILLFARTSALPHRMEDGQ